MRFDRTDDKELADHGEWFDEYCEDGWEWMHRKDEKEAPHEFERFRYDDG